MSMLRTTTSRTQSSRTHRDGVEVLDAFTGRVDLSAGAASFPGYHADISGDGALRPFRQLEVIARSIADVAMDNFSPGCWRHSVTSGAPDVQTVFEGSICQSRAEEKFL